MESALEWLAALPGLFLGTLLVARVGNWVEAIVTTAQSARAGGKASAWSLAAAAILHSGPWLLGLTACWAYYVLTPPHAPTWSWFFGGVCAAPILWAPVLAFLYQRKKRVEAERKQAP